jgi:hypothetical protein
MASDFDFDPTWSIMGQGNIRIATEALPLFSSRFNQQIRFTAQTFVSP